MRSRNVTVGRMIRFTSPGVAPCRVRGPVGRRRRLAHLHHLRARLFLRDDLDVRGELREPDDVVRVLVRDDDAIERLAERLRGREEVARVLRDHRPRRSPASTADRPRCRSWRRRDCSGPAPRAGGTRRRSVPAIAARCGCPLQRRRTRRPDAGLERLDPGSAAAPPRLAATAVTAASPPDELAATDRVLLAMHSRPLLFLSI